MKGPQFLRYIIPIVNIIHQNGGVGNSGSVIEQVIEVLGITEEDLEATTANGQSRIRNQIQWARFYLFKAGFIDNSQRGIWRLTKEGLNWSGSQNRGNWLDSRESSALTGEPNP